MGVTITEEHGFIHCHAPKLKGANINLDLPSVGATENVMLSAVLAEGQTVIHNAAKEPEIEDLQAFLKGMGAKIKGAGTSTIVIEGVKALQGVEHKVMPDRIVAGTYLVAGAITHGHITLTDVNPRHLYPITSKLMETGCSIKEYGDAITLKAPKFIRPVNRLITLPHPGFPTDMQAQMTALLTVARGTSLIEETVFESRNKHIGELIRMGANITLMKNGMSAVVKGVERLNGTKVSAMDLRGGAALILAAMAAEGDSIITNSEHVERGYDHIETALAQLGADITYVTA